jgi:hypothetical protein
MEDEMSAILRLGFACTLVLAMSDVALGVTESFDGHLAGTVIAGTLPGGGTAPGTAFPNITLSVTNNGGGPQSLIIFDSNNPTGEDPDLGTPHEDFGGPGEGTGGASGQPGENKRALNNLLIIAEDIVDNNNDGLVDDPDDEAGAGVVEIEFTKAQVVESITIIDIDESPPAKFEMYNDDGFVGAANSHSYGDNAVETFDLSSFGHITRLVVTFAGSAGIGEIVYRPPDSPTESTQWGKVKEAFF